jgi:hypothetical protein
MWKYLSAGHGSIGCGSSKQWLIGKKVMNLAEEIRKRSRWKSD